MNSPYQGKFYVSQGYYPTKHDGLDLVGVDSKEIHATQKGVVHFAGWENPSNHSQGFGQYVCIKGIDGWFYYFGHLSKINVVAGQSVKITDVIGIEGSTGYSTGSHCHYEVRKGFYKGAVVLNVCSLSGIPNKERVTYDDGYRPSVSKPVQNFKVGDLVKINSGAKYYDGTIIPSWVQNDKWYVASISGDRIVLGLNKKKDRNIQSPIKNVDIKIASLSINNADDVKTLQTALNDKGYKCNTEGKIDSEFQTAMFDALCNLYSI